MNMHERRLLAIVRGIVAKLKRMDKLREQGREGTAQYRALKKKLAPHLPLFVELLWDFGVIQHWLETLQEAFLPEEDRKPIKWPTPPPEVVHAWLTASPKT